MSSSRAAHRMGKTVQAVSLIVTHCADESPLPPATPAATAPQPAARRAKLRLSFPNAGQGSDAVAAAAAAAVQLGSSHGGSSRSDGPGDIAAPGVYDKLLHKQVKRMSGLQGR
jgi:hypothetical protein